MKILLTFFALFLTVGLFGQRGECAANAGPDQTICYNQPMLLDAPASLDYKQPLDITWSVVTAQMPVTIASPHSYQTQVNPGPNWTPGPYTFQFCARCKDLNGDGVNDLVCDEVTIVVSPEPTEPHITEPDGIQDGQIKVCSGADITVNAPGTGEVSSISVTPSDGLVQVTTSGTSVHLERLDTNSPTQGECTYQVTYTIASGACLKSTAVKVTFIKPQDPDNDGIIEGHIFKCPSCGNTLYLRGDRPGCGGQGTWKLVSGPPGATASFSNVQPQNGDADVTVSEVGTYTFQYDVTNIAPCANSTFQVSCTVLKIGTFSLGTSKTLLFCDNIAPAGTYHFDFNDVGNGTYDWTLIAGDPSQIIIVSPHSYMSDVILLSDIDLSGGPIIIRVKGWKYYYDPDCEGPEPPHVIDLPFSDPVENQHYIEELQSQTDGGCFYTCEDEQYIYFYGAPKLKIETHDVQFLCSNGTEVVKLNDYFEVQNAAYFYNTITVEEQPAGSSLPPIVSELDLLQLHVQDCGVYKFKIEAHSIGYGVSPPLVCTTTDYLTISIEVAKPVTAGTDQVKCCNEPIRLNGNNPYTCGAQGTWSLVSCSNGCSVTFVDPHDPNTQMYLNQNCSGLPITLDLKWSFASQNASCNLSDVTRVIIDDCLVNCDPLQVKVRWQCLEGKIVLTAVDNNDNLYNPYGYTINWIIDGAPYPGNPVSVPYTGVPVNYQVTVEFKINDEERCTGSAFGVVSCEPPPTGCGIRIVESCDACGNIVLTAVGSNNLPVPPTTFVHNFRWVVYSGPGDLAGLPVPGNVNPITVQPGSCYSLVYEHFIYPPGAPPIPGTWTDICRLEIPITCTSIQCPGPCEDFGNFFIAGCGDVLDATYNLTFPQNCYNVCSSAIPGSATLGLFYKDSKLPVSPIPPNLSVVWEDGSTGTYVNGVLSNINSVTVTSRDNPCCFWKDAYEPVCCDRVPISIHCEQPIVKHCNDDGSVTYTPGPPQITWYGVAGAIGYQLEITHSDPAGCCEGSGAVELINVTNSPWVIPSNYDCFTIRIRAIFPDFVCTGSSWSAPYTYCERNNDCSPVIVVCGCCEGRSAENTSIPTVVMNEEEMTAYLKAHPGKGYQTLREALAASGLAEPAGISFAVFPNPATDAFTIRPGNADGRLFHVQLYDMLQRQWKQVDIEGDRESVLDVSQFPKGIYLLTIRDAGGELMHAQKITVLR